MIGDLVWAVVVIILAAVVGLALIVASLVDAHRRRVLLNAADEIGREVYVWTPYWVARWLRDRARGAR